MKRCGKPARLVVIEDAKLINPVCKEHGSEQQLKKMGLLYRKAKGGEKCGQLATVEKDRPRSVAYELAKVYALQGKKEEALKWLHTLEEEGFIVGLNEFAHYDPPFESLWGDPEFESILERASERIDRDRIKLAGLQKEGLL